MIDYYKLDSLDSLLPLNHVYNLDYLPIIDYKTFRKESINSINISLPKKKRNIKKKIQPMTFRKFQQSLSKHQLELLKKYQNKKHKRHKKHKYLH